MRRLGSTRFVTQAGDLGRPVAGATAVEAPAESVAIHPNFQFALPQDVAKAIHNAAPLPTNTTDLR